MLTELEKIRFERAGSLFIYNRGANLPETMRILARDGLKPLTYQEALAHAPELIKKLQGKWFYLKGVAPGKNGVYTWDENGELVEPVGDETPDKRVYVASENWPLAFDVDPNQFCQIVDGKRFYLGGYVTPDIVATAVVGIKETGEILEGGRAALERLKRGTQR